MDWVVTRNDEYLEHFGIKGQKHGIRRYQNEDGSLTPEGKERYGDQRGWEARQMYKRGTITKDEMKKRKKGENSSGVYDFMSTGNTRRTREFQRRHEKGMKIASSVLTGLGGAAIGAVTAASISRKKGSDVVGLLLGGAAGAGLGYAGQAVSNYRNRKILEDKYNRHYHG